MEDSKSQRKSGLSAVASPPRELLERVRSRDPVALEQFFDHYFHRIFGLARRLLGDRDVAEDVTQDIFHKVYAAIDRLDPDRDPVPWLTVIACNTCRKYWRSSGYDLMRKSASFEDTPGLAERINGKQPGPEANLLSSERERRVREAIDSLPDNLRESVVLHMYEGMGHEEIAETMGVTHVAARKRYSRALDELGKRLKDLV
jgi:RNA polymerase sigma factor (sigma-70 family)